MGVREWSESDLVVAVQESETYSDVARKLGLRSASCHTTIKKYIKKLGLDISHFDASKKQREALNKYLIHHKRIPLSEILVENSTYNRACLKKRLYKEGLKKRVCEKCGQTEIWHGKKMSLILDHINGINNDHRLENLRVLCPNCAATLETHCAKNKLAERCPICNNKVKKRHKFCSRKCRDLHRSRTYIPRKKQRKVERPSRKVLLCLVKKIGYAGTGRKYGVSDNAVRKWIKLYEKERDVVQR